MPVVPAVQTATPDSATTDPAILNLEQLLSKVASGGMAPLLTKQVLDKLLEAAAAAAAANLLQQQQLQQQQPQQPQQLRSPQTHSSLPDLTNQSEPRENRTGSVSNDEGEDEIPADTSSPVGDGSAPRKSNLMSGRGKNSGADARQLSVRFDPNQVSRSLGFPPGIDIT